MIARSDAIGTSYIGKCPLSKTGIEFKKIDAKNEQSWTIASHATIAVKEISTNSIPNV